MSRSLLLVMVLALALAAASPAGASRPAPSSAAVRPVAGEVAETIDLPDVVWGPGNRGAKLVARPGEPVRAALAGTVRFAGQVAGEGWVSVDHGGGLDTTYGPVETAVPAGRRVRAGAVIARVPEEADRLHWGARVDGEYVDPLTLLRRWRPRLTAPAG